MHKNLLRVVELISALFIGYFYMDLVSHVFLLKDYFPYSSVIPAVMATVAVILIEGYIKTRQRKDDLETWTERENEQPLENVKCPECKNKMDMETVISDGKKSVLHTCGKHPKRQIKVV